MSVGYTSYSRVLRLKWVVWCPGLECTVNLTESYPLTDLSGMSVNIKTQPNYWWETFIVLLANLFSASIFAESIH